MDDADNNDIPWWQRGPAPADDADASTGRSIVVNGRRYPIQSTHVEHAQLVRLAYPDVPDAHAGNSLTVTYRGGPLSSPDGILAPTGHTPVADGEIFIVARTDKS